MYSYLYAKDRHLTLIILQGTSHYRWREKYAGMTKSDLAEYKALQEENRRLRHIVSELSLDNAALKEVVKGKW